MPTFQPLSDYVLIRRLSATEHSKLVIPDRAKEKPLEGVVVAVGPGKLDEEYDRQPMELVPGDRVLFRKYAGTTLTFDEADHICCHENEVLGVIR